MFARLFWLGVGPKMRFFVRILAPLLPKAIMELNLFIAGSSSVLFKNLPCDEFAERFAPEMLPREVGGLLVTGAHGNCCVGVEHGSFADPDALWAEWQNSNGSSGSSAVSSAVALNNQDGDDGGRAVQKSRLTVSALVGPTDERAKSGLVVFPLEDTAFLRGTIDALPASRRSSL